MSFTAATVVVAVHTRIELIFDSFLFYWLWAATRRGAHFGSMHRSEMRRVG
jgi:hypothetical protein